MVCSQCTAFSEFVLFVWFWFWCLEEYYTYEPHSCLLKELGDLSSVTPLPPSLLDDTYFARID